MNNDKNDALEPILSDVAAVLEEHNEFFLLHRRELEQLFRDNAEMKQRLDNLEAAGSRDSNDAKFLKDVTARLKAISTALEKKV